MDELYKQALVNPFTGAWTLPPPAACARINQFTASKNPVPEQALSSTSTPQVEAPKVTPEVAPQVIPQVNTQK
jgi:hypothetical protein